MKKGDAEPLQAQIYTHLNLLMPSLYLRSVEEEVEVQSIHAEICLHSLQTGSMLDEQTGIKIPVINSLSSSDMYIFYDLHTVVRPIRLKPECLPYCYCNPAADFDIDCCKGIHNKK